MERRKPRSSHDELAIVKAAAWAWYERTSAVGEAKVTEFELQRAWRPPPPSRYKLEAMRARELQDDRASNRGPATTPECSEPVRSDSEGSVALSPTRRDSASSLFDSYEIARIAKQLNSVLEASKQLSQAGGSSLTPDYHPKGWTLGGFWARQAMGVCGTRVEAAAVPVARRRRRRNRVGAVGVEARRPRAPHAAD